MLYQEVGARGSLACVGNQFFNDIQLMVAREDNEGVFLLDLFAVDQRNLLLGDTRDVAL